MDYTKSKQDALQRKFELLKRREEIHQEKEKLDRENGDIERELLGLEHLLEGLEFLGTDNPPEEETVGFTEMVRRILQQAASPMTAVEIRDAFIVEGVKPSSPKVLLISIHTVLGRLESDLKKTEKDGKAAYIWKHTRRVRRVLPRIEPGLGFGGLGNLDALAKLATVKPSDRK